MPAYFTGQGNDLGNVSRSQATSFTEVVNMHLSQPILLAMAKARFDAMEGDEKDRAKRVKYLIAATYLESPHQRMNSSEVQPCNLIFLDIDPVKVKNPATGKWEYTGQCPAAPFVANPELLAQQLHPYNFAAYVTASHTAQHPRMRVVVDADAIPPHRYPEAVNTVAKLLGLPVVTSESRVVVQAMYLPVMFNDQTQEDHPLLTYVVPGDNKGTRAFTEADIIEGAGTGFAKNYTSANRLPSNPTALDFLRPPVDEVSMEVVREALRKVDPDVDRIEWLRIGMALKHQFSPHQEEEAWHLFDEWSQGELSDIPLFKATKYEGDEKTRASWDSFRPSPDNRVPVTVRTLLHKAVEGGWSSTLVKAQCVASVLRWIQTEAQSISQLLNEGIRRVAATPLLGIAEEDMLITAIQAQAKSKFGNPTTINGLRKELAQVRKQLDESAGDSEKKVKVPAWAKSLLFVSSHNEFFRRITGERFKPEELDNTYGCELPLSEDYRPIIAPRNYLLNQLKIERVYDYEYNPSEPHNIITKDERGLTFVNTYIPTYPEPRPQQARTYYDEEGMKHEGAGAIFYRHICNLIAEPQYRTLLVDWLAYLVKFPGRKMMWAPLIQGAEGAGKTIIADAMRRVLGRQHIKTIDISAIKKGWNEWSNTAQLVVCEEIRVVGTNRHEIMSELKPLITNDSINVNERHTNSKEARNRTNYLLFTNWHDALALTSGDRRYFVVKSALQTKAQVLALGEDYFAKFYHMLDTKAAGLRAWFEGWEFSAGFKPMGHAPVTTYLEQLIADSATDAVAAVRRIIEDGTSSPLIQGDMVSSLVLGQLLATEENIRDITAQKLAHILRDEGFVQSGRHMLGSVRHYIWTRGLGISEAEAADLARNRMEKFSAPEKLN